MDINELERQYREQALMLQTWHLGKQLVGKISSITKEAEVIIFERVHTEEPIIHVIDNIPQTIWEPRERNILTVSASTEFEIDPLGRITFPMGKLGLATIFPPSIDPKQPLPTSTK